MSTINVFKQLRGTAVATKMAPAYAIIFMDSLEEEILSNSLLKPLVWWRYTDDIFIIWKRGEEELQKFLETVNCYHPTIKFTAEYSRAKINFLDISVMKKGNQLVTDLYVKPFLIGKSLYFSVKPYVFTEFVLKTPFLIKDVMNWRRYG